MIGLAADGQHTVVRRLLFLMRPPIMTLSTWFTFMLAAWAISISPGAGAVCAMSCGLKYGFRKAFWNTLGLIMGIMLQILVVSLGLGALLATSELAFSLVKWLGVAYLIYLGIRQIRGPTGPIADDPVSPHDASARTLFTRGFLINASNPKGTVFLLAVVPQFLNPGAPMAGQYGVIAATLAFTDLVVMSLYALLAARVLTLLRSPRHIVWMNRTFGSMFVLAGVALASFKRT